MSNQTKNRQHTESGNALFLILIAVILFAALSYAITQSNRGSGAPNRETSLVSSTTITQYSSAIRTGVTRLMLRGIGVAELKFDAPGTAGYAIAADEPEQVFHPNGGGVSYQSVDTNVSGATAWVFLTNKVVTDMATPAGDIVAVLPLVKDAICERINEQIRQSPTIPASALTQAQAVTNAANAFTGANITGQPFGCVTTTDGAAGQRNVYYHVLAEQ